MRLVKMFFDIPEYHDEGRLPAGRDALGPVLGPIAGIYASPFLQGFTRPAQIYEQGMPGTLSAIVVVDLQSGETIPQTYRRLQLADGMNCVWLYVDPPTPGVAVTDYLRQLRYRAFVSHPADSTKACDRRGTMGAELPVVAVRNASFSADSSYPGVARFDTDQAGNLILGFRCLNAFCEVGATHEGQIRMPDGLIHSANKNIAQWLSVPPRQREVIKAWHDEQALAIRDAQFVWRPSAVRARITPVAGAAELDSIDFNQWRRVATISIQGTVPSESKYYGWGLRQGKNHVEYQYNAARAKWEARIVRQDGAIIQWRYMIREVHHDVTMPPVVRFRWMGADDGVWAPCGNACCRAAN